MTPRQILGRTIRKRLSPQSETLGAPIRGGLASGFSITRMGSFLPGRVHIAVDPVERSIGSRCEGSAPTQKRPDPKAEALLEVC